MREHHGFRLVFHAYQSRRYEKEPEIRRRMAGYSRDSSGTLTQYPCHVTPGNFYRVVLFTHGYEVVSFAAAVIVKIWFGIDTSFNFDPATFGLNG